MENYFGINFMFNRLEIHKLINKQISIKQKGYVCVVDGNVVTHSFKYPKFNEILNNSMLNLCDGSSIALLAGLIHNKKLSAYTGPEIFSKYLKENYRQCFIGNTPENLSKIKSKMISLDYNTDLFKFIPLPFQDVEDFEYQGISKEVNDFKPDMIWVSLGAPKQEYFISKLFPSIEQGILFAIGAAFNFFLVEKKKDNSILEKSNLVWLSRVLKEPKRVGGRALDYLFILPKLILKEIKNKKKNETVS
jgi:N-acetylglucosaminyldiphosphoundecaprenol N-acetyl-beta-D-mannosaminyltransferase